MTTLEDKLQNIHHRLNVLLPKFQRTICVTKVNSLPGRINQIVTGENRVYSYVEKTIQEITEDDLSGVNMIRDYGFDSHVNLTDVTIPNNIKSIGLYAFSGCTSLTTITIPQSVMYIYQYAFSNCNSLTDIYFESTTPPIIDVGVISSFTTTIHVPVGSGDAYKSATNWSQHADKIVEDIVIE